MDKLKFSSGKNNAKLAALGHNVYTFSLPSGYSCPGASECLGKAVMENGRVHREDGPKMRFRCFSTSQEVAFSTVRVQRFYNFDLLRKLKTTEDMASLIQASLPQDATIIRVHVAGDHYSPNYMKAWFKVAELNPAKIFFSYTKSLNYWVKLIDLVPKNFKLTASKGGKYDNLISEHALKYAQVVFSEKEAADLGLEIDHDDKLAIFGEKPFALLLHGNQKSGTLAAKALKALNGVGSYSKTKKPTDETHKFRRVKAI